MEPIATARVVAPQGPAELVLFPDEVAVYRIKRSLLGKSKAGEVIASKRRAQLKSAQVDKDAGVLEITFVDGADWRFGVPADQLTGAQQIVAELAASGPV